MGFNEKQASRLVDKLRREIGSNIAESLEDPHVLDIMLNEDGSVWQESISSGCTQIDTIDPIRADNIVTSVASITGQIINEEHPIMESSFPINGERFQGVHPPVTQSSTFAIRKHRKDIVPLERYVEEKEMTLRQKAAIEKAVCKQQNIIVCGGTGSGKTTLTNAILNEAVRVGRDGERYVVIEDTRELVCAAKNKIHLHAINREMLSRLTQTAMRLRPDRIVLGEVRGREAYDLLYLLNSGHPGSVTTLHSNSASSALQKFEMLARESGEEVHPQRIVDSFDVIVSMVRTNKGRKVDEILKVEGHDGTNYLTSSVIG